MVSISRKLWAGLSSRVTAFDRYSRTIMLTYQGEDSFKTLMGGFSTIITYTIMTLFAVSVFINIREQITANVNSLQTDMITDRTLHYPSEGEHGLIYGVQVIGINGQSLDKSYYDISAINTRTIDPTYPQSAVNLTVLDTTLCNETGFPSQVEVGLNKAIDDAICITTTDYMMGGTQLGLLTGDVDIVITPCIYRDDCALYQESVNSLEYAQVEVFILNSYFDFNNLEEPIQRYVDNQVSVAIQAGSSRSTKAYVRRNEYTTNDDMFGFSSNEGEFYSVSKYEHFYNPYQLADLGYFRLKLVMDPQTDQYERTLLTFWEAIGI